jgi:hypothetical protein
MVETGAVNFSPEPRTVKLRSPKCPTVKIRPMKIMLGDALSEIDVF